MPICLKIYSRMMTKFLPFILILNLLAHVVMACHRGGSMGIAEKDPGMFSVDITLSPTFAFASSSGTSGCKDWDYSAELRRDFVQTQWALIREESSRGTGIRLNAFSGMMGCFDEDQLEFKRMLRVSYKDLYHGFSALRNQNAENFLEKVKELVRLNNNLNCSV